jgi:hypothetical protein
MSGGPLVNYEFNSLLGGQSCQECKHKMIENVLL